MRKENYFVKKLQIVKESMLYAKSTLDHLDVQINLLKARFDHDKKVYNDQAIRMQQVIRDGEKRIPELEKKIAQGFTTIDMRTGKAFKSFSDRHIGLLQDKIKKTEDKQKEVVKKRKEIDSLKKKPRKKLNPQELDAVIAEEVREEAQPPDELKANRDKEMVRLKKEAEAYREKIEKLESLKKELAIREKKGKPEEVKIEVPIPKEELKEDQEAILEEVKEIAGSKLSELHEGKEQCPECKEWFTKGGAFAAHYKSHFNGE